MAEHPVILEYELPAYTPSFLPGYANFLKQDTVEEPEHSTVFDSLRIQMHDAERFPALDQYSPVFQSEVWELWQNPEGGYLFIGSPITNPRWLEINPGFTRGSFFGPLESLNQPTEFFLRGIDMPLYVNWLARNGDVILHASGVKVGNEGYAFIGPSGAGKSTLARSLAALQDVKILGEDQVVLRNLEGCFWIYGTPWHETPEMCSPEGAPLKRLFFLHRDYPVMLSPQRPAEAMVQILQTAFIPYYQPQRLPNILANLSSLTESVPLYNLSYQLGADILPVITNA